MNTRHKAALQRLENWGLGSRTRAAFERILAGNSRTAAMADRYLARVLMTAYDDATAMLHCLNAMPRSLIAALTRLTKSDDLTK